MKNILPFIDAPALTVIGTPLIFLFFVGIVFYVYSKKRKKMYEDIGKLPLENGQ